MVSRASRSEVVSRMAGELGPCSAWPEQVGRAHLGVNALVRDHEGLGRAREEIDADAAVELALGLRHIGVAGPHQHVDWWDGSRPERHGADRLDAAEAEDLVGAG
jgi:hypothetical protein